MYAVGYEAMNMRDIAARIDRKQGSLYNYFDSKQDLLYSIIEEHMVLVLGALRNAIRTDVTPLEQLVDFIEFHITYHIDKRELLYVVSSELRSLTKEYREKIVSYRKQYEAILHNILDKGKVSGEFTIYNTKVVTFSILALLTSVSNWYHDDGGLGPKEIIQAHVELIVNGVLSRQGQQDSRFKQMASA